ncbi:MAG: response regulator [Gammaproteobacteria bacterium]|nr:response regulator [Gammaproteobacteria bacterium]
MQEEQMPKEKLLTEVEKLRWQVQSLEQEKTDLEILQEMTSEHCDEFEQQIMNARNNLESQVAKRTQELAEKNIQLEQEVQERKHAQKVQSDNLIFLETLLNSISNPIFYKDTNGIYLGCNQAFLEYTDLPEEHIIGHTAQDYMPEEKAHAVQQMDSELIRGIGVQAYESSVHYEDGSKHDFIVNKTAFSSTGGQLAGIVGIMVDISEHKRIEEALRESEERFGLAMRGATDGLWDWNLESNAMYFSSRWKQMIGYADKELRNHFVEWYERIHPDDLERVMADVDAYLEKKSAAYEITYRLRHKAGYYIWILDRGIAVWNKKGKPYRFVGTHMDMSEQKKVEEALLHAKEAAEEASQAKSSFLANMSHELRTPLNAIIGYSELLTEDMPDLGCGDLTSDVNKISAAGKHLLSLINDVLDISKIEAGKMDLYNETFDLETVVCQVAATVEPMAQNKRNTLKLERTESLGNMHADLTKVRQMLLNLLSNAFKFTEKGMVTLGITRDHDRHGDWITFRITDQGIGMTPEEVKKLFKPFTQADASTTRKYGGTGLGLAITRRFAEMMGGTITVESLPGQGSTFTIHMPACVASDTTTRGSANSAEDVLPKGRDIVLIIDDDPVVRELLQSYISKLGCQVVTAGSGQQGLKLAKQLRPSAITLDVMMPGMDGWMVLSKLKNDPELAAIPVIMLSIIEDKSIGYALGADEYLTKPINRDQLGAALEKYVRKNGAAQLVMVVEDDPVTQEMLAAMLRKMGWQVQTAENGQAALDCLAVKRPDLIISDLMMPEMDGFEFIVHLRDNPIWRSIPVMVLTAKDITAEDREILSERVTKVFQKSSYRNDELLVEIKKNLSTVIKARKK